MPCGFASGQETGKVDHLPNLQEDATGGFGNREAGVRADVEDADLHGRDVRLDLFEKRDHLVFLAGVGPKRVGLAPSSTDGRGERFELVNVSPDDDGRIALAGIASGDCATQSIAGSNNNDRFVGHSPKR